MTMAPLCSLRADLDAARKDVAARPVVDFRHIRELARLTEQVGQIAARRLARGG